MGGQQDALPVVETGRQSVQQRSHHPAQQHRVELVGEPALLTQEADQFTMETGEGDTGDGIGLTAPGSHGSSPSPLPETRSSQPFFGMCRPARLLTDSTGEIDEHWACPCDK